MTIRDDVAGISAQLPNLGSMERARWALVQPSDDSRAIGPTDLQIFGLAWPDDKRLREVLAQEQDWEPDSPSGYPAGLDPLLDVPTGWVHSEEFDKYVTSDGFSGKFLVNEAKGVVYFYVINPHAPSSETAPAG
ncbi:hypothetical protein [Kitasatospora sp. NPDC004531]